MTRREFMPRRTPWGGQELKALVSLHNKRNGTFDGLPSQSAQLFHFAISEMRTPEMRHLLLRMALKIKRESPCHA